MNKKEEELMEKVEKLGWGILNSNKKEDEEGEWTFIGAAENSVIDYGICNAEAWKNIKRFKVEERVKSDHQPLKMELTIKIEKKENQKEEKERKIEDRSVKGIKRYQENLKKRKEEKKEMQEKWRELRDEIEKAISKKKLKIKAVEIGKKKWWDKECRESKRRLNQTLSNWKKGATDKEKYKEEKRGHTEICERKQKKEREREQKKIMDIKDVNEIWKYIKNERRKEEKLNESMKKNNGESTSKNY